jgi:hypothetical protein
MSDLRLVPFSDNNTPIVLAWRNSDRIRKNMLDDSVISTENHREFLKTLESDRARAYYVVELRGTPVAAIYFTELGGSEVTWGCYIGTDKTMPGLFVALVIMAAKYSFRLPSTNSLRSEVAEHNANPIKLNRFLGIPEAARLTRLTSSGRAVEFIEYQLSRDLLNNVIDKAKKIMPSSLRKSCENIVLEI